MIAKDQGFVLRRYNFRDTSLIVTVFTENYGKIQGLLKGFYTNKKEFTSPLEVYSLNEFVFYPRNKELWLVSYVDLIINYDFLIKNLNKNFAAASFCQLLNRTLPYHDSHREVFNLSLDFFSSLAQTNDVFFLLLICIVKFLTLCGFKPEFKLCIHCQKPYKQPLFVSVSEGGVLCQECAGKSTQAIFLNPETSSALHYIQHNSLTQALRLKLSNLAQKEILQLVGNFCIYYMQYDPFSLLKKKVSLYAGSSKEKIS